MDYNSEHDAAAGFGAGMLIFCLAVAVISYAGLWKMFVKAGKPGWAAIIPIYNYIVMIEIVGKPVIWILWLLIPCVNIVFGIWLINLLSKSFGKSEGYTIGMLILPFIFFPLLGFGDAKYVGPSAAEAQNKQDFFNSPPTTPDA